MRLKFKPSFFIAMLLGLLLWFGAFEVVKAAVTAVPEQAFIPRATNFLSQNWIAISLVLSELASLLPGPWNGIVQSILRALTKKARRNNSNH